MNIERARLRDAPALAWIAAQAFAAESTRRGVRCRARGLYLRHLYSLNLLACGGRLWHWEKKAIIAIESKKPPARGRWLAPAGACAAVIIGLLGWISIADRQGLQILLAIMKAGGAFLLIVIMLLLPAVIPALRELHPQRSAQNANAIRQWKKVLPGREAYKISYLAMYPHTMEGLTFATTAINHVVPAGAALCTEARSDRHQRMYTHRGLRVLSTKDGTPTLAMGTH
ncbi:hypothetical protein ACX80D_11900 [Arthrobacter sp. Sr24]